MLRSGHRRSHAAAIPDSGVSGVDFSLDDDLKMVRDTVARFVRSELLPLEASVLRREAELLRGLHAGHLVVLGITLRRAAGDWPAPAPARPLQPESEDVPGVLAQRLQAGG